MKYSKFGGNSAPGRILLKYIPFLIQRRERKEELFEIIETKDREDRRKAFTKLRAAVRIYRPFLEIFEYSSGSKRKPHNRMFGKRPNYTTTLYSEQDFYTVDRPRAYAWSAYSIYFDYHDYLKAEMYRLNKEFGKGSIYYDIVEKYKVSGDYPAQTSSNYDYDEDIYEFITGLMRDEKYEEDLAFPSALIVGKRGDIRAKDRIIQRLNNSDGGARENADMRRKLRDMLEGIDNVQKRKKEEQHSKQFSISEKGRDIFKP